MKWLFFFAFGLFAVEPSLFSQKISKAEIVTTRAIEIADFPKAYNPSLISYKDGYLLSFRHRYSFHKSVPSSRVDVSVIGIARLDSEFKVIEKSIQLLKLPSYASEISLTAEDGRLLPVGDRIFLFFNDLPKGKMKAGHAMYLAELEEKEGQFSIKGAVKELIYDKATGVEKNWSPFLCEGKCYCIYSESPERVILEVDLDTGNCREVSRNSNAWSWNHGQMRGGTPAFLVDGQFLTFFHSSFHHPDRPMKTYVMGAYLFEPNYPFAISQMIPYPLSDRTDHDRPGKSMIVTFPGGLVIENSLIHVAWGFDDKKIFITTFDKKKLLSAMKPRY